MPEKAKPFNVPAYNHNLGPRNRKNIAAAKARGWRWDSDWHSYIDEEGYLVSGRWHNPKEYDIRRD